jgi:hypothetical protein
MGFSQPLLTLLLVLPALFSAAVPGSASDALLKDGGGRNYSVTVVADGLSWCENLLLHAGSLWASDMRVGNVLRYDLVPASGLGSKSKYNETVWVHGMGRVLGLAGDPADPGTLYTVGLLGKDWVVLAVDTRRPQNFTVLATTQKCGNGLGLHHRTGMLYSATEGDFLPGNGAIYQIPVKTQRRTGVQQAVAPPSARVIADDLWAADGLWIDQKRDLLYVGQLFEGNVLVFNISDPAAPTRLGKLPGLPSGSFLDDFTLSADGSRIIGCDWSASKIVSFPAWGSAGGPGLKVLVDSTISHPTSARFGVIRVPGEPFGSLLPSLFVSEGDTLLKSSRADRIWRVDFH